MSEITSMRTVQTRNTLTGRSVTATQTQFVHIQTQITHIVESSSIFKDFQGIYGSRNVHIQEVTVQQDTITSFFNYIEKRMQSRLHIGPFALMGGMFLFNRSQPDEPQTLSPRNDRPSFKQRLLASPEYKAQPQNPQTVQEDEKILDLLGNANNVFSVDEQGNALGEQAYANNLANFAKETNPNLTTQEITTKVQNGLDVLVSKGIVSAAAVLTFMQAFVFALSPNFAAAQGSLTKTSATIQLNSSPVLLDLVTNKDQQASQDSSSSSFSEPLNTKTSATSQSSAENAKFTFHFLNKKAMAAAAQKHLEVQKNVSKIVQDTKATQENARENAQEHTKKAFIVTPPSA